MPDPASNPALHPAITAHYMELITTGKLGPDHRLPPIERVAGEFHVSRATVNKAYKALVEAGVAYSTPQGTFVREPTCAVTPTALALRELSQGLVRPWQEETTHLTAGMVTDAPGYVLALWGLPDGTPVGRRESVLTYRGTRRLIVSWHPPHIVAECQELVADPPQIIEDGTLHLAVDRLGHWDHLFSGRDYIRARGAYEREARLLDVPVDDPVLAVVGDRRDGKGVLELVETVYPRDTVIEYKWVWQRQR